MFSRPHDLRSGYSGEYRSSRFRVDSIGAHGSRLIVRDYRATVDNGVYRCFTSRYDSESYAIGATETIFMEIDVDSKGWAL